MSKEIVLNALRSEGGNADLQKQNLNKDDMKIVAAYIMSQEATTLKSLHLNWNDIGDEGAEEIFRSLILSNYCKLVVLNLGRTEIGIKSIKILGEYLQSPTSSLLQSLFLDANDNIGDQEVRLLSDVIPCGSSLNLICLNSCKFGDRGALFVDYLLSDYNISLSCMLCSNKISRPFERRISKFGSYNRMFKSICNIIEPFLDRSGNSDMVNIVSEFQLKSILNILIKIINPISWSLTALKLKHKIPYDHPIILNPGILTRKECDQRMADSMYYYYDDFRFNAKLNCNSDRCNWSGFKVSIRVFKWRIMFIRSIIWSFCIGVEENVTN